MGVISILLLLLVGIVVIKYGIHSPQSHFKNISKSTLDIERTEVAFDDGVKTKGIIYRLHSETVSTPNGRQYPKPRPAIIYFHGFYSNKEVNEMNMIALTQLGYVTAAFDQRGHGEAGGKKEEWFKLYNDVQAILDKICSYEDVREGSICCIGKSMGGTSVLTKGYQDERVAMVIGISALHDVEIILNRDFRIFSSGWFVKRIISQVKDESALTMAAHYFLAEDLEYNKNRVYLIHGKKDEIFPPSISYELNKKQAKIPKDHAILLDNCGHNFEDQEFLVLGIIIRWLFENKKMRLYGLL